MFGTTGDHPKVFISYSHDSREHADRVLGLCNRLRADGFDAVIDQFVVGFPAEGWPRWQSRMFEDADFVIAVCTETYLRRFELEESVGTGKGVKSEGLLIVNLIYSEDSLNRKTIPIVFDQADLEFIPNILRGGYYELDGVDGYVRLKFHLRRVAGASMTPVGELAALAPLPPIEQSSEDEKSEAWRPAARLRVFLCHGTEDKKAVRELYRELKENGLRPWLDEEDIEPGQEWEIAIQKAVRRAHVVLVCLSRTSVSKTGFVNQEIKYALDRADDKPAGTTYIIPAKLDECDVPRRLSKWQWIDLQRPHDRDRLMNTLKKLAQPLREDVDSLEGTTSVDSAVKITLIDVGDRMAETNIPFRLKVYCEMRNDSNRSIEVRISTYIPKELKVMRNTPGALQLKFQPGVPFLPDPSAERVAVLPGQTFRAWIAPDEALFNKASFDWLRSKMGTGEMGTLVLNVDGQEIKIAL